MYTNQNKTSNDVHSRKTITQVLFYWTEKAIKETTLTQTHLSELLEQRDIESRFFSSFSSNMTIEQGSKILAANHKKTQRYLKYETILPADLVAIWCDCLPGNYMDWCKNEIVSLIEPQKISIDSASKAIKELADAVSAIAEGNDKHKIKKEAKEAMQALKKILGGAS